MPIRAALNSKVIPLDQAVRDLIKPGYIVGLGGQNINRCPMALVHEVVRQGIDQLTVVGCNLSLPLDLLVAAGLVRRTEQGSGNLERYGVLFSWRRMVEQEEIEILDYSHLGMASRFLAGSLGLPYMPIRSLLGSDILSRLIEKDEARLSRDPWTSKPVALVKACTPDVAIIHASRADEAGNVMIDGVTSHEVDMVKASKTAIVTVEEVVAGTALTESPESVTLSGAYVDAIVLQPYGAYPTSVYRRYDYSEQEIEEYQSRARRNDDLGGYLNEWIHGTSSFDDYLERRDPDGAHRRELEERMRSLL